ncbi:copper resistance CopC family protein [Pedococcus sp. 5OH_020]|uniref:copper resistance CopC family protein n=1 Tax=Pedococcus sp. 5OH_020 TaxID=2989814 RepID=UPI0022E9FC6B|nr:copper resistance CopC family protein [Pedococcus sp. 5OH_020]
MFIDSTAKRRTIRITVWVAILGLVLGVLATIVAAATADAHAALKQVTPADGAQLDAPPGQVVLVFDETVSKSFATVTVTGPSGQVESGRPEVVGDTVTQVLTANLPSGEYTVAFHVVSDDGHPVSDTSHFTLTLPAPAGSASGSATPTMTPLDPSTTAPTTAPTSQRQVKVAGASGTNDGATTRVALAVGVAALALAAGTALVAMARGGRDPGDGTED